MTEIPTLESVSPDYARLVGRRDELNARLLEIHSEQRRLHSEMGVESSRDVRRERVAALAAGLDYEPPEPVRNQLGKLADEARTVSDALHELGIKIADAHRQASRKVVEGFTADNARLATKFWGLIAEAAKIHIEHGEIRQKFMRAGVDPAGLHDFGRDLFGPPGQRNNDICYELRAAAKRGYIGAADIPEAYR